jgi:ATP-dependent DNA helicase RecQ
MADQARVPPYVIFPDKSLREMARTKPCDLHNFRNISGVGEIKREKYGLVFTSAIKNFCEGAEAK